MKLYILVIASSQFTLSFDQRHQEQSVQHPEKMGVKATVVSNDNFETYSSCSKVSCGLYVINDFFLYFHITFK